jgi:DNA-binding CsgD family transcriptional regulator
MNVCPTCQRPLPDEAIYLTDAERAALSAWWWLKSTRAAATALGLSEQTVKNQLLKARNRNHVSRTVDLAFMYMAQLDGKAMVRRSHKLAEHEAA